MVFSGERVDCLPHPHTTTSYDLCMCNGIEINVCICISIEWCHSSSMADEEEEWESIIWTLDIDVVPPVSVF